MYSDVRLMDEADVRFLIDEIIEGVNDNLKMLKYDYGKLRDSLNHYWYYNDKLILELHDSHIIELLFDYDALQVQKILIDKLKELIK